MSKATIDLEKDKFDSQNRVKISGAFGGGGKTTYTQTEIDALANSTDINDWIDAYNDGQLLKKFVQYYDGSNEQVTYYTHPSLTSGKCLKILRLYTDDNSNRVLQSETPSVADWNYESDLTGDITLTLGSVTSPVPNAAAGVDVVSVTVADSGDPLNKVYQLTLTGTNANLYRFHNVTQNVTASSLGQSNFSLGDTVVVETASQWAGVTYSHTITVVLTETNSNTQYQSNFSTSGTAAANDSNEFAASFASNSFGVRQYAYRNETDHPFGGYGKAKSFSLWFKVPTVQYSARHMPLITFMGQDGDGNYIDYCLQTYNNTSNTILYQRFLGESNTDNDQLISSITSNEWHHVVITFEEYNSTTLYTRCYFDGNTTPVSDGLANHRARFLVPESTGSVHKGMGIGGLLYITADQTYGSQTNWATSYEAGTAFVDEVTTYDGTLNTTDVTALWNNGVAPDMGDITLNTAGASLQRWYRFGDGPNDSASQVEDVENAGTYMTSSTDYRTQLTMNDEIYKSNSGNHKYVGTNVNVSGIDLGAYGGSMDTFGAGSNDASTFAVSFWAKAGDTSGTTRATAVRIEGEASGYYRSMDFDIIGNNLYVGGTGAAVASIQQSLPAGATVTNWNHYVISYEAGSSSSNRTVKIYINGSLQSTTNNFSNTYFYPALGSTTNKAVRVAGRYINYGSFQYNTPTAGNQGTGVSVDKVINVDEVILHSSGLSPSVVTNLYNSGSPTDITDITNNAYAAHWFRMGDGDNDTGTSIACYFHPSAAMTSQADYRLNH